MTAQPAIDGAGTIYVVSADQRLYALTPWGDFKWSLPLGARPGAPSIAPGADVVLGTAAGDLVDVTPDGEIRWKRPLGSAPVGAVSMREEIATATTAGAVVGLAADGSERWRSTIPGRPGQLFAAGAAILAETEDGTVFTLQAGAVASRFNPGTAGGIVLDPTGVPVLGGRNWVVHALDRAALGLAAPPYASASTAAAGPAPWPQPGHDWMHSGRTEEAPPSGNDALLSQNPDYLYLQGIGEGGDRDSLQLVLREIAARVNGGSLGKSRWYVTRMLESITGSGIIVQVRENQRLINDFPDLRAAAAALLGRIGSVASRSTLLRVADAETDTVALAAEIRALGTIASDGDGASARAIAHAFTRTAAFGPDGRVAAAAVDALGRIAVYEGSLRETAAVLALSAITRGPYDETTRQRAVAVLQGEPKVDILDVEE